METKFKIIDEDVFNDKISDIDLSSCNATNHFRGNYNDFRAVGTIAIQLESGEEIESTGEHSRYDFDEYGFELYCDNE